MTLLSITCTLYSMSTESVPDLFRYAQSSVFTVKSLGHLGNEQGQRGAESRQSEVLETIDAAQVSLFYQNFVGRAGTRHESY